MKKCASFEFFSNRLSNPNLAFHKKIKKKFSSCFSVWSLGF